MKNLYAIYSKINGGANELLCKFKANNEGEVIAHLDLFIESFRKSKVNPEVWDDYLNHFYAMYIDKKDGLHYTATEKFFPKECVPGPMCYEIYAECIETANNNTK